MNLIIECIFCFVCMLSFGVIFKLNYNPKFMIIAALNAVLGWIVYSLSNSFGLNHYFAYFAAALTCAIAGEIIARAVWAPASIFYVIGCLPLVPGGGIYHTMLYAVQNRQDLFISAFIDTIAISGSISMAILVSGTFFRLFKRRRTNENIRLNRRI